MRTTPLLLLASLLAAPLLGQRAADRPAFFSPTGTAPASTAPASSLPTAKLSERAFFSLAGEAVPPGARELRFEIRIDGRTALKDVLRLPLDAAGGTFELLAGDPQALARLSARAAKAGRHAEISVALDGRTLRTLPFAEFLVYNRQFQKELPSLRKPVGETRDFAAESGQAARPSANPLAKGWDLNCIANCDTNRDYCYQTEPECAGVDYCETCETQWGSCHDACWTCEEPKSVSQYTSSWIKSTSWAGGNCLEDVYLNCSWFDFYNLVIESDRYQRTEHCDGSYTDSFLYSWDTSGSCERESFYQTCTFAVGYSNPPYCPF